MQQSTRRAVGIARAAVPTAALGLGLLLMLVGSPAPLCAQVTPRATASAPAAESPVERALESRAKGSADAGVVVFEIADFQCPYCATFAATVAPALDERYVEPGHVHWIFVNLPLHSHPLAWHAAEAALCAGAAGDQFWPMHDRLFEEQDEWGADSDPAARFATYAADLGVPADPYAACTEGDQVASLILQDLGSAISAGITGTPTFIIMKGQEVVERMVGVQSILEWSQVLDNALGR
ncbi:MAG: DsbA family protein [Gemmatimonadales bacterium]